LSERNNRQLFIPEGFAHGFCVLSDIAHVAYKCSVIYHPEDEGGIRWSDPTIGIDWPITRPIVSIRDDRLPAFGDLSPEQLFHPVKSK
jgi:dTDP-4-dehydrorhamnose 3,5-epimerase